MTVKFMCFMAMAALVCNGAEPVPDHSVCYKQVGNVDLMLHVFNPSQHSPGKKVPCIVFFHGGGWNKGDPSQFYRQSAWLASRGMVAISVEYRIKSKNGTAPSACVIDAKSAMRWVRSHADELGIDSQKIAAGGGSAGGQMAAATALSKGLNEEGEDLSVDCRPNALVLFNPVFDNGPDGFGYQWVKDYWQDFSPMHNIHTGAPPTLVMLGTEDQLIPVATAEKYKTLMEQVGSRCDLILYEGEKHSFFNGSKYSETLAETDRFLTSLGYLKALTAVSQ